MAYIDDYNAAHDPQFNQRVRVALLLEAQSLVTAASPNTTYTALIPKLMTNTEFYVQLFCDLLAANGVTAASTDSVIQSGVGQVWQAFAGVI